MTHFQQSRLQIVIVVHINHANEIDPSVRLAFAPLRQLKNVTLLNQSVLCTACDTNQGDPLSEALFAIGILPYYLHLLDKVQGSTHFFVEDDKRSN